MSDAHDAALLAQLNERLRQEREVFDQQKDQDRRNHILRLTMGWVSVVLFVAICAFSGLVILNPDDFSSTATTVATTALLVEALGLVMNVWRLTVGNGPRELEPTTQPALTPSLGDAEPAQVEKKS